MTSGALVLFASLKAKLLYLCEWIFLIMKLCISSRKLTQGQVRKECVCSPSLCSGFHVCFSVNSHLLRGSYKGIYVKIGGGWKSREVSLETQLESELRCRRS